MAKPEDKPDMKMIEERTKEAKAIAAKLEQGKKSLAALAAQVKALDKKVC